MAICKTCGADNKSNDTGYCKFCLTPLDSDNRTAALDQDDFNNAGQTRKIESGSNSSSQSKPGGNIMVKTFKPKTPPPTDDESNVEQPENKTALKKQNPTNDDEPLFEIKEVSFNEASVPGLVQSEKQPEGTFKEEDLFKEPQAEPAAEEQADSMENELDLYQGNDNYMLTMEQTEDGPAVTLGEKSEFSTVPEIPPQATPDEYANKPNIDAPEWHELKSDEASDDNVMTQKIIINPNIQHNKTVGEKKIEKTDDLSSQRGGKTDEEFFTHKQIDNSTPGTESVTVSKPPKIDEEIIKAMEGPSPIQAQGIAYLIDNTVKFVGGFKPSPGDQIIIGNNAFTLKEKPAPKIPPLFLYIGGGVVALITIILIISAMMPSDSGSIVGTLVNPATNEVVPKATITLKELNKSTQTSYAGFFTFDDVPPGLYTLELEEGGVGIMTERLTVLENRASAVKLTMPADEQSSNYRKKPSGAESENTSEKELKPGFMKLTLSPQNSQVYYDDKYIGKGTQTFKVAGGKHKVTVKADGYKSETFTVQISDDAVKSLNITLDKLSKSDKPTAKTENEIALGLERQGKFSEALKYYNKFLAKDKNDVEALLGQGRCLKAKGNSEEAMTSFLNAVKITSDRNDIEAQMEALDGILTINPNYLTARYKRGLILFDQGEYLRAAQDFNKVIEIDPRHLNAFYKLGESYYKAGNYPAAIEAYAKIQDINFADAKPYAYIAKSYMKLDDKKNTKKYYETFEKKADLSTKTQLSADPEWQKVKAMAQ